MCYLTHCGLVDTMWWHKSLSTLAKGNGLPPVGTKPLPEPMLLYHQQGPVPFTIVLEMLMTVFENYSTYQIKATWPNLASKKKKTSFNSLRPGDVIMCIYSVYVSLTGITIGSAMAWHQLYKRPLPHLPEPVKTCKIDNLLDSQQKKLWNID